MTTRVDELDDKLARLRASVGDDVAVRLRGVDWFSWLLGGASSAVLMAAETGVAEAFVLPSELVVLTDPIEFTRLQDEELPESVVLESFPWAYPKLRETWVRERSAGKRILSDRPQPGEHPLPDALYALKRELTEPEHVRYVEVGALAAQAMTETLLAARPEWTELDLAAAGAAAMLRRGLQPALILATGARRLPLYRHPLPTAEPLGNLAMLVFCARRYGLYANLTRFVSFGLMPLPVACAHDDVREVEAEALRLCSPGVSLDDVYRVLEAAYQQAGYPQAIEEHHQGGLTGYLAREALARPGATERIQQGSVLALNPSVRGAKIEDTFYVTDDGLQNLTLDPDWPTVSLDGLPRPLVMER